MIWVIILVPIQVANQARSEFTSLKCKWTEKWKGKGVDETHL